MNTEISDGRLRINGLDLPLGKGLILFALARAGWTGIEGPLSDDLMRNLFRMEPRIAVSAQRLIPALKAS